MFDKLVDYPLSSFLIFQVGGCTSNFGSTNQSSSIPPYSEKYITKSYFDKYDSLLDSDFLDFIAHELFPGSCEMLLDNLNLVLSLSVQQRALIGDGSHRHLSSSIRFNIQLELIAELPIHFCQAIIIEKLPSGIFADPFELQHLLQRGGKIYFVSLKQHIWALFSLSKVFESNHMCSVHGCSCFWRHKFGIANRSFQPLPCWGSHGCWSQHFFKTQGWFGNQHRSSTTHTLSSKWK